MLKPANCPAAKRLILDAHSSIRPTGVREFRYVTSFYWGTRSCLLTKMAAMKDPDEFYHRKLDRSPENPNFNQLPSEDKNLISHLRCVMETARDKVTKLRDEIDDK